MNIFAELWHSTVRIRSYKEFLKDSGKKTFLYGILITTIYVLITTVIPVAVTWGPAGNVQAVIEMFVPDFKLEDNRLWVEKPISVKEYNDYLGGIYVEIDTDREVASAITDVDLLVYDYVLIADADDFVTKYEGQVIRSSFEELDLGNWTRATLLKQLFPYIKKLLMYVALIMVLMEYVSFYVGAWVIAWCGVFLGGMLRYKLPFAEHYKLAVHARTPAIFLKCVCAWIPMMIPFFYAVNFGLSAVYVWRALLYMKESAE